MNRKELNKRCIFSPVNREKIITELYNSHTIRGIAKSMVKNSCVMTWEDLLHIAIIKIAELPVDKFNTLYEKKQLSFYMYGIMWRQNITPHLEFNKQNQFTGTEIIDNITTDFIEIDEDQLDTYTFDSFTSYCKKMTLTSMTEDVKLAAKVTYGYLIYSPSNNEKKSYRSFQLETGIHYSSICQYVKKMRELYIKEKNEKNSISI